MNKDVLFIFTDKYYGMILDCRRSNQDQYEILTKCHGLLKVSSCGLELCVESLFFQDTGRQTVREPLCTIDSKHGLILLRIFEGVIKLIYLKDLSAKDSSSKSLTASNVK